ncbi:hypothetical protein DFH11DRAFT_13246 [Phellopilus nigrolimitatus]|nr:hypothetical protein DFH11DRAFT_13246 [Phellopilus nigrolimitatus]
MTAKGLLLVFIEVSDALPESEFHSWYNDEHIPLRTALDGFKSATRFVQADGQKPTWGAVYDISDLDFLKSSAYTELAKTRSAREADVIKKLEYLERRVYTLNESAPTTVSSAFAGYTEGTTLVAVSIDVAPENEADFHKWYDEEHIPLLSKVPGWLRSRRFILADSGASGALKETDGFKAPPKFLALHEYTSAENLASPEWKTATSTPWRNKVVDNALSVEKRILKIIKTF